MEGESHLGRCLGLEPGISARAGKGGYKFEARLQQSAVKDGEPVDELVYAVVR